MPCLKPPKLVPDPKNQKIKKLSKAPQSGEPATALAQARLGVLEARLGVLEAGLGVLEAGLVVFGRLGGRTEASWRPD